MKKLLLSFFLFMQLYLIAQPGSNDTTFNITDKGANTQGARDIRTFIQLKDGSTIIGGLFDTYNDGGGMFRIGLLKPDGTPAPSSFGVTGRSDMVNVIAASDDEKRIYFNYTYQQNSYIVLTDSKGNRNSNFFTGNPDFPFESGFYGRVYTLTPLPNGKVLVGGSLFKYNSDNVRSLLVLDSTASIDNSFNNGGFGPSYGDVNTSVLLNDGKILIGGEFKEYNSNKKYKFFAPLSSNGQLDVSFNSGGSGPDSTVKKILVQDDGKIIIIGEFKSYNGISINRIARLNADGTLDNTFNPGGSANATLLSVAIQKDKKILIGGDFKFTSFNGTPVNRIARLNSDGSLDTTFNPVVIEINNNIVDISVTADNKILICGSSSYNGVYHRLITRLLNDGQLDMTFNPGTGSDADVRKIIVLNDKKILIAGGFTVYNNVIRKRLARLNPDGSLDNSIDPGIGTNGAIYDCVFQKDGKLLISGYFSTYKNISRNSIARLNADWSLDNTFNPGIGTTDGITTMVVQDDGKILIGGNFKSYNGVTKNYIARINTDGTLDSTFVTGTGTNGFVYRIYVQADHKIIVTGSFTLYNGIVKNRIVRLNMDGSIDSTFDAGTGCDAAVQSAAFQPDGKIVIGGAFNTYNDVPRKRLARIDANGKLDNTFDPKLNLNLNAQSILIQSNGDLIVNESGSVPALFQSIIKRFHSDGSLDSTFNTGDGSLPAAVYTIAFQGEDKLLIGGFFTTFNKMKKNRLARLHTNTIITSNPEVMSKQLISIYPNPTEQSVFIHSETAIERVEIYDALSHKVSELVVGARAADLEFNTSGLKNGMYLFHIISGNHKEVVKVVVQK